MIAHRRHPDDRPQGSVIDRIPVTGIARTLVDLAAVLPRERIGRALDDALRRELTSLDAIAGRLECSKRRTGVAALRNLIEQRDGRDGMAESPLESSFLALLRTARMDLPVPQHRVDLGGGSVARLDFAYPELRLGIEVDGYRWHSGRDHWVRDMRRENRLKLLGWTLLRFSREDVRMRPDDVVGFVRAALARYPVHLPTLSGANRTGSPLSRPQGVAYTDGAADSRGGSVIPSPGVPAEAADALAPLCCGSVSSSGR